MLIDIKPIRQQDPIWCGPACAKMLLDHYNKNSSQKQIAEEIPVISGGVTIARLGQYFLGKGFEATMRFWLDTFDKGLEGVWGGKDVPRVMQALEWGAKRSDHWPTRHFCSEARAFVNKGGKVELCPPNFMGLENEIRRGHPVIVPLEMKALTGIGPMNRHYMLVIGCTDRNSQTTKPYVHVNDPDTGKRLFVPADELLQSCKANYNCMVFVKPNTTARS